MKPIQATDSNFWTIFEEVSRNNREFKVLFNSRYENKSFDERASIVNNTVDSIGEYFSESIPLIYVDSFEAPSVFTDNFRVTNVPTLYCYTYSDKYREHIWKKYTNITPILDELQELSTF